MNTEKIVFEKIGGKWFLNETPHEDMDLDDLELINSFFKWLIKKKSRNNSYDFKLFDGDLQK